MADPRGDTALTPGEVSAKRIARRKIDVPRVFELALKGLSTYDIATLLGVSHQGVSSAIQRFKCLMLSAQEVATLDENMGRMVKSAMAEMLRIAVDPVKTNKLSARDALWNFAVLFDKNRILEGKSTANVFHGVMVNLQRDALESGIKLAKSGESARNEGERGDIEPAEVPEDAKLVSNTVPASETDEESGS